MQDPKDGRLYQEASAHYASALRDHLEGKRPDNPKHWKKFHVGQQFQVEGSTFEISDIQENGFFVVPVIPRERGSSRLP